MFENLSVFQYEEVSVPEQPAVCPVCLSTRWLARHRAFVRREAREKRSEASGRSRCGKICDALGLFMEGSGTQSLWSPRVHF